MALFRVPSKMIQYGYVEVDVDVEGLEPAAVAAKYMDYVSSYQIAESGYVAAKVDAAKRDKDFPEADEPTTDTPADEPTHEEAVDTVVEGLGATEVPDTTDKAPWKETPKAEPTAKKPWDTAPVFDWN